MPNKSSKGLTGTPIWGEKSRAAIEDSVRKDYPEWASVRSGKSKKAYLDELRKKRPLKATIGYGK